MSAVLLSICIPTRNRAPQLNWLLNYFLTNQSDWQNWEIVIADNASTDTTLQVCNNYLNKLPIKVISHEKDIGATNNLGSAVKGSSGYYCVYQADDDYIDIIKIKNYLNKLNEKRNISALYAPWNIVDQSGQNITQFYSQSKSQLIKKGDFSSAAHLVIENSIFPEIFIAKREIYEKKLKDNGTAFCFFTWMCQFIANGDVMFANEPFYNSFSQHPAGSRANSQAGHEQTMTSWDLYRGGYEVLLGAAAIQSQRPMEFMRRSSLLDKINIIIRDRMVVALRLCINSGRFLNGYWLYRRLLANTPEEMLPLSRDALIFLAALEYAADGLSKDGATVSLPGMMPKQLRDFACTVGDRKYINGEQKGAEGNLNISHVTDSAYAKAIELLKF